MASRWGPLIAGGVLTWGLSFNFDVPAALSTPLQNYLDYEDQEFNYLFSVLYSAYSIPNIILPFLSGFAIQKYGRHSIWMASIIAVMTGQMVFALGIHGQSRLLMVGGRLVLGFGGEVLLMMASDLVTRCFKDKGMAMALASITFAGTLGTVANTFVIPRLTDTQGVASATWLVSIFSVLVCGFSAVTIASMDARFSVNHKQGRVDILGALRWMPSEFGYLCVLGFTGYGLIICFNNTAQQFLAATFYHGNEPIAGSVVGLTHIIAGVLCFPFGWLLEQPRWKKTPTTLIISNGFFVAAHLLFVMQLLGPIIPVSLLGIANGLFGVALWPFVATAILSNKSQSTGRYHALPQLPDSGSESDAQPQNLDLDNHAHSADFQESDLSKKNEGMLVMAYGIMSSLLNLSFAVMPVILAIAKIVAGYPGMEIAFVVLSAAGTVTSVQLVRIWRYTEV